jgi:hypothetical protein
LQLVKYNQTAFTAFSACRTLRPLQINSLISPLFPLDAGAAYLTAAGADPHRGSRSKSPEEAAEHFGWISHFVSIDCPASSNETQRQLGWRPTHTSLIPDLDRPAYLEAGTSVTEGR